MIVIAQHALSLMLCSAQDDQSNLVCVRADRGPLLTACTPSHAAMQSVSINQCPNAMNHVREYFHEALNKRVHPRAGK